MSAKLILPIWLAMVSGICVGLWTGATITILRIDTNGIRATCEEQAFSIIRCEMLGQIASEGGKP